MNFVSICSGIEAASCALEPLGFCAFGYAEIDKAASRVLTHHFPSVPNLGDFTVLDVAAFPSPVDWLIGGTPCQAFSFAGKRLSLADARGNLSLAFVALAHELARSYGLRNVLWENVPGVLNTDDNAFGCFLGALVGTGAPIVRPGGGGWPDVGMVSGPRARAAWRILDAQYFGLAQRRERVFLVADFRNGADQVEVLFERQGMSGNSPPRREAGKGVAGNAEAGAGIGFGGGNRSGPIEQAACLTAKGVRQDFEVETFIAQLASTLPAGQNSTGGNRQPGTSAETAGSMLIAHSLRAEGFDASEDGTGRGTPIVPVAYRTTGTLVAQQWAVRRLTPTECERLQGFPDGWTATPDAKGKTQADGPRYKQLGNSMAVPVIAWIGRRALAASQ